MMILVFTLTMPQNNAWDGKWSGEGKVYEKVKNLGRKKHAIEWENQILFEAPYSYDFGDGWEASISVRKVSAKEAAKVRKDTAGFCGYDWMVTSILLYGKILNEAECL